MIVYDFRYTQTENNDTSGKLIREILEPHGSVAVQYRIVRDDYHEIQGVLQEVASLHSVHAILLNGGTGIARRDTTYEAVIFANSSVFGLTY
ncbi:molybdopterin-binding protein [Paenibacillus silviterrae]|uniref:molybdopterin-binding protein n=1 Tax=Paenibacillus silviterrae TaxID=3242194 RepID=UPI00350E5B0D